MASDGPEAAALIPFRSALDDGRVVESDDPAVLVGTGGTVSRRHSQYERARSWRIAT